MFLTGLMFPMMMSIVNMAMFGIALPTIRDSFGLQADVTAWVVTAYSLPYVIFMPIYGRLADELGKRRLFLTGLAVFFIGTVLSLMSFNLVLLFVGRVIQGIGVAGINPLCIALITEHFPESTRGKALGTWNSIGPFSGIIGPFLGGFLIYYAGWRTIFVPVLLIGILSIFTVLQQIPSSQIQGRLSDFFRAFDWGGVILLAGAMTATVFYLSSRPITGVEALHDWRLLLAAVLLFATFLRRERFRASPFVALSIFRNTPFLLAALSSGLRMFTMNGINFLMPLYLADIHHLRATSIGTISTIHAAALLLTMRIGGQLADHWSGRWPVLIGAAVQVGSALYFAWLPETASVSFFIAGLAVHGLGAGLMLAALHRSSMSQIDPEQTGIAAGLYSMIRFSGSTLGVALGGVVLQYGFNQGHPQIEAYQRVFWFLAGIALVGIVIAWKLDE